jgi:HAD superfamily hydrolase (TIGR01490 family)
MKNKIAIFDIDGTIFRKNLAFELINELVWIKVFPKEVRDKLIKFYSNWLEHKGNYEDYRRALVDLYLNNLKGCKKESIQIASQTVVPFHKDRTYIFANNLIERLKKEKYHIIAVSGSPLEIVEEFNKYLKFNSVFGTVYELDDDDSYTGQTIFEPTVDKGEVVSKYVEENNLTLEDSYGIGDTESDAKFLEIVTNPIAFNPNYNLKKIAERKKWKIVVEKKDVIYKIN